MKTQWTFHHCDRSKKRARDYWAKKTERIERLLTNDRPGLRRVCLTLYRHEQRDAWELRCVLHLPTGTLTVEDTSSSLSEVIDNSVDKLARSIGRHKTDLRRRKLHRSRKHRRRQFAAASPFLAADAESNRNDAFVALLMPYADQLYDHARRELRAMEREGRIPKDEWTPSDLVDEVLVHACETYDDRFSDGSIDVWLFDQLNRQLEDLRGPELPVTLAVAESEFSDDVENEDDLGDVHFWMERLLVKPEPMSLEEMVPDGHWNEVWDSLTTNEQRERLAALLQGLPKYQRQALMLKDAYGFETFEIVRATNRSTEDIEADLKDAREKVRTGLVELMA